MNNSTHTFTVCKWWVTMTSSNICEFEIALESDIGMFKFYNDQVLLCMQYME